MSKHRRIKIITKDTRPMSVALPPSYPHEGVYAKITDKEFDDHLAAIVDNMNTDMLLQIPGVYEAVAEGLNNDVLKRWERELEDAAEYRIDINSGLWGLRSALLYAYEGQSEQYWWVANAPIEELVEFGERVMGDS